MTNTDPNDQALGRHLNEEEASQRYHEAMDAEYEEVRAEFFTPGKEDPEALAEAINDLFEDPREAARLGLHMLHNDYGPANNVISRAIIKWCEKAAEMRYNKKVSDAEEQGGADKGATMEE